MNKDTLIAVCCYSGDAHLVKQAMPIHHAHRCPIILLSPVDSPVSIHGCWKYHVGRRAYIGVESLHRQIWYLEYLLTWPQRYFLINDADSFCVSAKLPEQLREADENVGTVIWSGEIGDSRPHASPYPKLAFQPPYFLHRDAVAKMLRVAHKVSCHPITPYVDWLMVALTCEAGLNHRPYTDLEHAAHPRFAGFNDSDPWKQFEYRIRYTGTCFCHPIKTAEQIKLCVEARKVYEAGKV